MNFASLLSAPLPTTTSSILTSAGAPAGSSAGVEAGLHLPGAFDALVSASTAAIDAPVAVLPLLNVPLQVGAPVNVEPVSDNVLVSDAAMPASGEASPTEFAVLSAATMAMLSALDRSAAMLSKPGAAPLGTTAADKDERPVATESPSPDEEGSAIPAPQTAALMSAFVAVGRALPAIVSKLPETDVPTSVAPSAPKASPPTASGPVLQAASAAMPALFNAIASELRPMLHAKAGVPGKAVDAPLEPAKESLPGVSALSPASAMIRELASVIADSVTASAPTDGVAVDRHLDLARGDAWLSDLANDIAATAANGGRLKFGLAPESLGRLDVEIRRGEAGVSVHMTTRTDTARDVLTAAQPRIVDEIRAQGVRVAGTEVSTDASGFGGDRAGTTPRQPLAMPIEAALSTANAAPSETAKSVADGRYA